MLLKEIIDNNDKDFAFENSIGVFEVPIARSRYAELRKKYFKIAMDAQKDYIDGWRSFKDCNAFLQREDARFHYVLKTGVNAVRNDLISMGIMDIDKDTILDFADQNGYFEGYQTAYDDFVGQVQRITGNLNYQKARREYRKNTRGKWVGATFSSRPNYVDEYLHQAELGMRNLAEGAGHSVINAVGNAMDTAKANRAIRQLYANEKIRMKFNEEVLYSAWNLHFVLIDLLEKSLQINVWEIPEVEDVDRADRLLNNLQSSVLDDEAKKDIIKQAYNANPYSRRLYVTLFHNYRQEVKSITEIAEYFGVDLTDEKEKLAIAFLKEHIGNTEEEARKAKEDLIEYYKTIDLDFSETLLSYRYINALLLLYDREYRTVDGVVFDTREEADIAKEEFPYIAEILGQIEAPTKDSTLEYENDLLKKREELDRRITTKIKDKYLSQIDGYLKDFDNKFCTISFFKKGTRKEAAKAKAVNFLKKMDTSNEQAREEATEKLKEYLPQIGLTEEEATEAWEYLKKKEHEEIYGKESAFSKITKGLGGFFKK